MLKQSNTLPKQKKKIGANKLVMGFAALAATAVIGTTGIAAAADGATTGNGYGNVAIDVGIGVNGNNNVIGVIINIFR